MMENKKASRIHQESIVGRSNISLTMNETNFLGIRSPGQIKVEDAPYSSNFHYPPPTPISYIVKSSPSSTNQKTNYYIPSPPTRIFLFPKPGEEE